MQILGIRILPVVVAAIACMILGFLWYSPVLFAKPWMVLMGYDPDDKARLDEMRKSAGKTYTLAFIASLISAFVLAKIIAVTTVQTALLGMKVAFAVWLGFVTTVQLTGALLSKQPTNL